MNLKNIRFFLILLITCVSAYFPGFSNADTYTKYAQWPDSTEQSRPWTRWWWMGSAVDKENLTYLLDEYRNAGIGGVEICPIYGAKGYEDKFLDFLSPEWMRMLAHTVTEANRIGVGVDLTTGTGWPFGGPMVTKDIASSNLVLKKYELNNGKLEEPLPKERLDYLLAISDNGDRIDVTNKVDNGKLVWQAPDGKWTLYAAAVKQPVQKVKRPAPGGDGYVLDPYSVKAVDAYLDTFDKAFADYTGPMPRGHFHDSFEYYNATWTNDFFDEFQKRRGYDLRDHLEALVSTGDDETVARVMCDYHETISDLHLDYILEWSKWCRSKNGVSRNQAHGAPANLIDLYGAVDIPETEIFRTVEKEQYPMLKFASSAAHLNGTTLASSESFTWLNEHFCTSLNDLKEAADFLFLSGINHIFYHGIPYSPIQADWPGWQFYASVNFGPGGGLWHDLPAFNSYVTRCQSILQSGQADNDILLYLPIYDLWQKTKPLHITFTVHNQEDWLRKSSFYTAAMKLWQNGYSYDAVSDKYLQAASCENGIVVINNTEYEAVVIPSCKYIQPKTVQKLIALAGSGANIIFEEKLPTDVPGFAELDRKQKQLHDLLNTNNKFKIGELKSMLSAASVTRETAMEHGIAFVRRQRSDGFDYFFVNRGSKDFDGWMTLGTKAESAILMDPMFEDRIGTAKLENNRQQTQVYLRLKPLESIVLRTFTNRKRSENRWVYTQTAGTPITIDGTWNVEFIAGGPALPNNRQIDKLVSWTTFDDPETERFYGTARYTISFDVKDNNADDWMLNLGKVCDSARVALNGKQLATLWAEPFEMHIGQYLKTGKNVLSVEVTNSAANRIRDMDRRKVNWKYFYDINVVNINYKPFDASDWKVADSGLLGPVNITPLKIQQP